MQSMQKEPINKIKIEAGFWKSKQDLVNDQIIAYQWKALNDEIPGAEPSHAIENFKIAAGLSQGSFHGLIFQDSDVGKWIEAASYSLSIKKNSDLENKIDSTVELIAKAQEPDGYIQTYFTVKARGQRYTDFAMGHEMYCGGHLIEGAVAYFKATGKSRFLDIMSRYADHLDQTFGIDPGKKVAYCGHPEIELALFRLYEATGQERYQRLAQFFLEERGRHLAVLDNEKIIAWPQATSLWNRPDYYQDHLPIRQQMTAEGHSVRAMYLYSAMADYYRYSKDETLKSALDNLWNDVSLHKMYITGGLGSQATGERFTVEDDLPSDTAYTETCAAIGLCFWAWRMTIADQDSKYADVFERALYNGALSGISLDGTRYFYVNPLEVVPDVAHYRRDLDHVKTERVEWFGCACCPPNIARMIGSFGQYQYSSSSEGIWAHHFAQSEADVSFNGKTLSLKQETKYPWDGQISFELQNVPEGLGSWNFSVRIPQWCSKPTLLLNGKAVTWKNTKGYAVITREWKSGDTLSLDLPMEIQIIHSSPRIRETFSKVAIQRGPLIYCMEEVDNGKDLHLFALPFQGQMKLEAVPELGSGALKIRAAAYRTKISQKDELYTVQTSEAEALDAVFVPYHLWGNRGPGEMRVWINIK